jgi:hypothetical protein
MTVEAERLKILAEREGLKRRYEEDEAKLREEIVARMTMKDRLMRRLKTQTFKVILEDDLGDIPIELRLITTSEINKALEYDKMYGSGDSEKMLQAHKGFSEMLDDICMTEGLRDGFWSDPDCPAEPAIKSALVMRTAVRSADIGRRIRSFRDDV